VFSVVCVPLIPYLPPELPVFQSECSYFPFECRNSLFGVIDYPRHHLAKMAGASRISVPLRRLSGGRAELDRPVAMSKGDVDAAAGENRQPVRDEAIGQCGDDRARAADAS